jgi:hypothetical protein
MSHQKATPNQEETDECDLQSRRSRGRRRRPDGRRQCCIAMHLLTLPIGVGFAYETRGSTAGSIRLPQVHWVSLHVQIKVSTDNGSK